ncbi:hypothetical protein [Saccharopolyspora sp. NPDC049426]|uniref:hypothetical protein n=1 Tax=Saccharopolyspora sp. NPDC049426 TaxID=3155652 RepID=UPI003447FB65
MNAVQTGLLAGLILGVAAAAGGFTGFLIALVLGAIGVVAGRVVEGELDLGEVFGRGGDR